MIGLGASLALNAAPALLGGAASLASKDKYKDDSLYKRYDSLYKTLSDENRKPYLETSGAKSVLASIREASDRRMKRITASAAINGMTDEAKIAAMGKAQEGEVGAISQLGGNADAYRQNNLSQMMGLAQGMQGIKQQKQQETQGKINDIVGPLSSATQALTLSGALGQSSFQQQSPGKIDRMGYDLGYKQPSLANILGR